MASIKLKEYMKMMSYSPSQMATKLGRTRQNVEHWLSRGATIDFCNDGALIVKTEKIVHEPQVRK